MKAKALVTHLAGVPRTPVDRQKWADGPLIAGYCDCCGVSLEGRTTKRGDELRFCSHECRMAIYSFARSGSLFLFQKTMEAQIYKHKDPDRANRARSEIANHIADVREAMDSNRKKARDAGNEVALFSEIKKVK